MCNTARRNLRLRFFDYVRGKSETKDGRFVDFMLTHRHGYSKLTDITVDGVDADLIYGACLEGAKGAPLESITLKNLKLTLGSPNHVARAAKEKPFLFNCGSEIASGLGGVRVANLTVPQWSDEWAGLSSARPAQDVPPTGIAFAVCEDSTKSVVTEQPPLVLQSHVSLPLPLPHQLLMTPTTAPTMDPTKPANLTCCSKTTCCPHCSSGVACYCKCWCPC